MAFTRVDLLSAAQQSLAAAGAHDRGGWIGLFTDSGRVEDPVGSQPHRGHEAIGRFYDTFIGPRIITFRPHGDIVVDTTVIRDVELEIAMASTLTMRVPTFIRYDLQDTAQGLRISALSAYWELPAMLGQFARGGLGAVPSGIALGRAMLTHQGLRGGLGFVSGFRGIASGGKGTLARLLDHACSGDEVGIRRLAADISITRGDTTVMTRSDLVKQLTGGTWDKLIRSGTSVSARVERSGMRGVLIGETGATRAGLSRLRLFGELE